MTATLLRKVPKRVCPECGRFVRVTRGARFAWHYPVERQRPRFPLARRCSTKPCEPPEALASSAISFRSLRAGPSGAFFTLVALDD